MTYDVNTDAYTTRIKQLLDQNDQASLLYAALELRCGVEGRMKEYLCSLDHVPKSKKKEYSVVKLGRTIDNAFQLKDQIGLFTIFSAEGEEKVTLRYIPIPKRLKDIAARAGDVLHFSGDAIANDPKWWQRLRAVIEEGYGWLAFVATGDLIGLPLIAPRTNMSTMRIFFRNGDPRSAALYTLAKGGRYTIKVAYEVMPKSPPRRAEPRG